jgi:hypothetical protein
MQVKQKVNEHQCIYESENFFFLYQIKALDGTTSTIPIQSNLVFKDGHQI